MDYLKGGTQKNIYTQNDTVSVPCPLCQEQRRKEIYKERKALSVVRCCGCGLLYVSPRLKNPEQVYWGEADKYLQEARLIFEGKQSHHRDKNYLEDLRLIKRYKPAGKFLDIGANMGFFLNNAKKNKNWQLYGVEPSASLSDIAQRFFGLNIRNGFLADAGFDDNFFDIVTMTDVFEHLTCPGEILGQIRRVLKPDGILFIKVPNGLFNLLKFRVAKALGRLKDYDIFDSYEHVVHYTDKTLKRMLKEHGFKVVKVGIGSPIQLPVWHKLVGFYYQYPTPWMLDFKKQTLRNFFYFLSIIEFYLLARRVGNFAPNIIVIASKVERPV